MVARLVRCPHGGVLIAGWVGFRDVWWYEVVYNDKIWEYRYHIRGGFLGEWLLVRCSFALFPEHSSSLRLQFIVGAIRFDAISAADHGDVTVYRPEQGYLGARRSSRTAFHIGKVIVFPLEEWWSISYTNLCSAGLHIESRYGFTARDVARACELVRRGQSMQGRVVQL